MRFGFTLDEAGNMLVISYLMSSIFTPVIGYIVDKVGKRVTFMYVANIIVIICYVFLLLVKNYDHGNIIVAAPLIGLGMFYAIFASVIWPCFPLVTSRDKLGKVFGRSTAFQNIGISIIPILVGYLHDAT